jgi:hypothetical protein
MRRGAGVGSDKFQTDLTDLARPAGRAMSVFLDPLHPHCKPEWQFFAQKASEYAAASPSAAAAS